MKSAISSSLSRFSWISILVILTGAFFITPNDVFADTACTYTLYSDGTFVINDVPTLHACTFPQTPIDGLDWGTGTTNTSTLRVPSTMTVTIQGGQQFGVGKFVVDTGGAVVIGNTGSIVSSTPLWYTDADGDGYASSAINSLSKTAPANGVRKKDITQLILDCNDSVFAKNTSCLSAVTLGNGTFDRTKDTGSGPQVAVGTPTATPLPSATPTPTPMAGVGQDGSVTFASSTVLDTTDTAASIDRNGAVADAWNTNVTAFALTNGKTVVTLAANPTNNVVVGDEVLLINLQGTASNYGNVGKYEFLIVESLTSTTVSFTTAKSNVYGDGSGDTNVGTATTNQRVMMQRVPHYTTVTINGSVTVSPSAWDGTKNGVLAFRSTSISNSGIISASSKGYRGGAANSNGGESLTGVNAGGTGGIYSTAPTTPTYGGGGGAYYYYNGVTTFTSVVSNGSPTGGAGGGGGQCYFYTTAGAYTCRGGSGAGGGYGAFGYKGTGSWSGNNGVDGGTNTSGNGGVQNGTYSNCSTALDGACSGDGGGGGTYGSATLSVLHFGSGGGAGGFGTWSNAGSNSAGGAGGIGGGIIYVTGTISGSGTITNVGQNGNAAPASYGGAGGGGAGGSVYIDGVTSITPSVTGGTAVTRTNYSSSGAGGVGRFYNANPTVSPTPTAIPTATVTPTPVNFSQTTGNEASGIFASAIENLGSIVSSVLLSWTSTGVKTTSGETPVSTTGLVAQWNFNATSGTSATNDAGVGTCGGTASNCNGTLTNMASTASQDQAPMTGWTNANKRWGASGLMFDGTNDYVNVPDTAALDVGSAMSVSMWVNELALTTNKALIGRWIWQTDGVWAIQTDGTNLGQLKIFVAPTAADAGTTFGRTAIGAWTTGWHHLVMTYDGTQSTDATKLKIYIDGVAQTLTFSGTFPAALRASAAPIRIGDFQGLSRYWNGYIDAVQLFSRALTATEVLSTYTAGSLDMQYRSGASANVHDGTWGAWTPTTSETSIDTFDSDGFTWDTYWTSGAWADGSFASWVPRYKGVTTLPRMEGTNSLKASLGSSQPDVNTMGIWHLDETSGTGAYLKDSVSIKHGTPTGTTSVNGIVGKARNFNGSSDFILIPASSALDQQNLTIEAWVYSDNFTRGMQIFEKTTNGSVNTQYSVFFHDTGVLYFRTYNSVGTVDDLTITTATYFTNNAWNHVACSYTGGLKNIYVNGVLANSKVYTQTLMTNPLGTSIIGAYGSGTGNFFNGSIDEVRVSNIARTGNEIYESYRAGRDHRLSRSYSAFDASAKTKLPFWFASDQKGTNAEATVGESAFVNGEPDANTLAMWHFDETAGSGTFIFDATGNTHGTPTNAPTIVNGQIGKARQYNGTSQYISIADSANFNLGTNATIDFWVNTPDVTTQKGIFGQEASTGYPANIAETITGKLRWFVRKASGGNASIIDISSVTALAVNTWYHVALVKTGTTYAIYLNGTLDSTATSATATEDVSSALLIGARSAVAYEYYPGIIDELRISNVARTADEIRQVYEYKSRVHQMTVHFKANLIASNLITGSSDLSFMIDETPYGTTGKVKNLFMDDAIIVKENVNGTEYVAQGVVDTVNADSGAIAVTAWHASSTFPTSGFTVNATVFKWQQEWWDISGIMVGNGTVNDAANVRNVLSRVTFRFIDGSKPATYYFDDLKSGGPYITTSGALQTLSPARQYFQFRSILSTVNRAVSPVLSTTTYDLVAQLTLTPTPVSLPQVGNILDESFEATKPTGAGYSFTTPGTTWAETIGAGSAIDPDSTTITPPTNGGSQALKIFHNSTATYAVRDYGSKKSITYTRFYFYLASDATANSNSSIYGYVRDNLGNSILNLASYRTAGGVLNWMVQLYNNGALASIYSSVPLSTGTWYKVEFKYDVVNKLYELRINDASVASGSLTGTYFTGVQVFRFGNAFANYAWTAYFDRFAVDSVGYLAN